NNTYQITSGTSVAAAHVSGVAALLLDRDPNLDTAAVRDLLESTAKDLGSKGRDDQFGWGLVDPYRALKSLDAKVAGPAGVAAPPKQASRAPPPANRSIPATTAQSAPTWPVDRSLAGTSPPTRP